MDILEKWRKEMYVLTSDLNIRKPLHIERWKLDHVVDTLYDVFGKSYFEIKPNPALPYMPQLKNSNWLHTTLSSYNVGSILQLMELGKILRYFKHTKPAFIEKLVRLSKVKEFRQFRDFYFELITYHFLDSRNIKNRKKVFEGNKELEGTCYINNHEFLFECKKLYSVNIDLADTLNYLSSEFNRIAKKNPIPVTGYVVINSPLNEIKNHFSINLKNTFSVLRAGRIPKPFIEAPRNDAPYLVLEPYKEGYSTVLAEKLEGKNAIIFDLRNPTVPNGKWEIQNQVVFNVGESQIINKLENILKTKRRDRRDSSYPNRIYFLDNEFCKNFDFPLLPMSELTSDLRNKIQSYIESKNTNDVLCLFMREARFDRYQVKVEVFCRPELNYVKEELLR